MNKLKLKRPEDKIAHKVIKWVMTAIFAWSGFLWSGITALQFLINSTDHRNLAIGFLIGSLILLLCLILCRLRLYILQFIPAIVGLTVFLIPAREMIDHAADTGVIFKPSFEVRYMPMIGLVILSFVLFIMRIALIFFERSQKREEYNNLPSESVLDRHSDE